MRAATVGKYGSYTWHQRKPVYVYGGFYSSALTALDELAAPKLWTLPRDIQAPIRDQFYSLCGTYSWDEKYAAQKWIHARTQELIDADLSFAYDHEQIRQLAVTYADICRYLKSDEALDGFCTQHGVEPPNKKGTSTRGRLSRARSIAWWTRRLFKRSTRRAENGLRSAGFIRRQKALYSSDVAGRARSRRAEIFNSWIDRTAVVSDEGDSIALRSVYDASVANPTNRRHELMTRLKGMDRLGVDAELVADFITLTLPSKYHAALDKGGINPQFNGATVRDGQAQLRLLWSRFRARAAKQEIFYYGLRVAEPHHDGTPHWHLVLYTLACDRERVRELLRELWLSEDGDEPGAREHRVTFMACDRSIGTPAGYLAKYIAKNIDGYKVGADFDSAETPAQEVDAEKTSGRVLTWAWIHGIRQFQFFGTARVGLWRELRKIREPIDESGEMEVARLAADEGDWARFVSTIGGVFVGPNTEINLWKEITGELNHYDELAGPQIVGIQNAEGMLRTRLKVWRLERGSDSSLGPVSITVTSAAGPGNPGGWTNPRETGTYGPN